MMALLMPPAAFNASFPEPDSDRAWTVICIIGVIASYLYPFVWLTVAS